MDNNNPNNESASSDNIAVNNNASENNDTGDDSNSNESVDTFHGDDSNSDGSADTFHVSALNESREVGEPLMSRSMSIVNRFFNEIDQLIMEVENGNNRRGRIDSLVGINMVNSSTPPDTGTDSAASNVATGDNNEDDSDSEEVPFDIQLPYQHLYLSRNFQALPGHTYLEEGSVHTLSFVSSNVITGLTVLIPGQTIPLNFIRPGLVAAMRDSLDNNKNIFGFLMKNPSRSATNRDIKNLIGVTLEIFEIGNDEQHQQGGDFCGKGRVTQRFRLLEIVSSTRPWMSGRVVILPEIVLEDPLHSACPSTLLQLRRYSNRAVCELHAASFTAWPGFVYRQYEVKRVVSTAKQYFLKLVTDKNIASCAKVPDDPVQLSYWVLINFPMSDSIRVEMLSLNNALQRLQRLIEYFKNYEQSIRCIGCFQQIGNMKNVFFMSASGPQGTYVNPSGYIHETITLYTADQIRVDPELSTEYSWFPGYAWSVATCARCHCHVGWRFTAVQKSLVPKLFYGITKRAITLPGGAAAAAGEHAPAEERDDLTDMLPQRLLVL
uniref:Protein cereblon n=1 Tax=Cacopsylla melanoneura TaxID=428564 RepID=A0A8D8W893_9HEMI